MMEQKANFILLPTAGLLRISQTVLNIAGYATQLHVCSLDGLLIGATNLLFQGGSRKPRFLAVRNPFGFEAGRPSAGNFKYGGY
jgi:hypothetical protein